jgi:L-fuconolactonase
MITDSHCHVAANWYEPVESLLAQMDRAAVERAVLVQLLGRYDNEYLRDCHDRYPDRFDFVGAVDPAQPEAIAVVSKLADQGAAGIRLRPTARSPGENPLAIWEAAQSCGLTVSCVGNSQAHAASEFSQLVCALPRLRIVLEHFGGTSQPDTNDEQRDARRSVFALARHPNVYLKLPGLGELLPRQPSLPAEGIPLDLSGKSILTDALTHFGPSRLMWGSDFPVVSSREGYANALHWCQDIYADQPPEARTFIFGATARSVFRSG